MGKVFCSGNPVPEIPSVFADIEPTALAHLVSRYNDLFYCAGKDNFNIIENRTRVFCCKNKGVVYSRPMNDDGGIRPYSAVERDSPKGTRIIHAGAIIDRQNRIKRSLFIYLGNNRIRCTNAGLDMDRQGVAGLVVFSPFISCINVIDKNYPQAVKLSAILSCRKGNGVVASLGINTASGPAGVCSSGGDVSKGDGCKCAGTIIRGLI